MRKKSLEKLMAALLVGAMAVSMVGCGSEDTTNGSAGSNEESEVKNEVSEESSTTNVEEDTYFNAEGFPICDEPITITVAGCNSSTDAWNDTVMVAEIESQFGIIMDCSELESEAWDTQFTLMVASDELPDLLVGADRSFNEISEYGQEGYFLPINEYLDYMPNFKAFLEAHPDYAAYITSNDGNIYGLTQYNENQITALQRTFINGVWLENVGKEVPTNVDELYDVLKAFKEQDANGNGKTDDEIPFSGSLSTLTPFLHAFGIASNNVYYSPILDKDGNVVLGNATENFKAMLTYLHKLYDEGLYDVDGMVQTSDEFNAKCQEDRIGAYTTASAPYVHAGQEADYDANWEYWAGLTSDYNDVRAAVYNSGIGEMVKLAVSANTEYPEAVCRLIDYFYSDEGSVVASRGFMGVTTQLVPSELDPEQMKESMIIPEDNPYGSGEEYRYKKAIINEGFNVRRIYYATDMQILATMSDERLAQAEAEGFLDTWTGKMEIGRRQLDRVDVFPTIPYTDEESERRSTLKTDIQMYVKQSCGQFISGELDIEKDWDTYVATLKSIGMDELVSIEQAAYDRAYN